jgi:hypothetical protein
VGVEHDELEEVEAGDGLVDELAERLRAHHLDGRAGHQVDRDHGVGQELVGQRRPVVAGDRVGVGGQQAGDCGVVDRRRDVVGHREVADRAVSGCGPHSRGRPG